MIDKKIREQIDAAKIDILGDESKQSVLLDRFEKEVNILREQGIDVAIYKYDEKDSVPNYNTVDTIKNRVLVNNLYLEIMGNRFPFYITDMEDTDVFLGIAKVSSNEYKKVADFIWFTDKSLDEINKHLIKKIAKVEIIDSRFVAKEDIGTKFHKTSGLNIQNFKDKKEVKNGR